MKASRRAQAESAGAGAATSKPDAEEFQVRDVAPLANGRGCESLRENSGRAPLAHARGCACPNRTATVRERSRSTTPRAAVHAAPHAYSEFAHKSNGGRASSETLNDQPALP